MGEINSEKIMLENDTFALKRDYKRALELLDDTKKETAQVLAILEKANTDYEQKQEDLRKVVNDISQEKLDWAQHRNSELIELENQKSEAQNVLKRKAELNEQEQVIRDLELKNIEILNETRRMELALSDDRKLLEVDQRELEENNKKLKEERLKLEDNKKSLKLELTNFVKEWQTKLS